MKLDDVDLRILKELQRDASRPASEIAELVNLSTNACWRRIKLLQESGVIKKQVALVDPAMVGKELTVFVELRTAHHGDGWLESFSEGISKIDEVVEFHRLNGNVDYLLKILVSSIEDYDRVYKKIIRTAPLHDVTSYFSMEKIKETTEVPLDKR
ncbi:MULTISPECIES: Lrp/AsnC family transcriptional regulator [Kiloniella]|jgi:Lrp/AsnC family transcriptional regulator|uniref:Transcriptional regulator n=1 Tax=Kiloniella litopenaei TaxID=1549748 RepID=A0A0M2R563_9PROT|nr:MULTISPECIES: Lrp/AsnC family transcriptional regulator [Kiloniella]KKJ77002.1 transcriptional regulator [Kiloniella litopenaei]